MAARDQAARIVRPDDDTFEAAPGEATPEPNAQVEPLRARLADEPVARKTGDAPPQGTTAAVTPPAPAAKSGKRKFILMGVAALVAVGAIYYGVNYLLVGRFMVSTDDAYVRANNTTLGARVSGHLSTVAVADNSTVKAGDLLFRIDDGDYVNAVDAARARIATQQATIDRIGRQVSAQESAAEQAKAQVASADAGVKRTEADYSRQQELSTKGFASRATFEVSLAGRDQAAAALQAAKAAYDSARDGIEVTKAQQAEARAQLGELQTSLAKAERDLSFTTIRAPIDGVFSNRLVNEGDYIQPGQRLANIVPLNDVFIDANFKETQLKRMRVGQPLTISVDAYGHRKFSAVVDSISPAAGSVFTLLPPDNATGNFTKIVQRLPVRIRVPAGVAKQNLLRAGMSVTVTVDTRQGAGDADNDADLDAPLMIHPQ